MQQQPYPPRQYQQQQSQTLVREYQDAHAYQRDAAHLATQGWRVQNVTNRQPATGCMRGCLLGFLALIWRPKPVLVVTYVR